MLIASRARLGVLARRNPAKAEGYFKRALAVARKPGAKYWRFCAATSMAGLSRDQGWLGTIEDVEGCEQRGGAVTFVVVCHRPGAARLYRQFPAGCGRVPGFGSHEDSWVKVYESHLMGISGCRFRIQDLSPFAWSGPFPMPLQTHIRSPLSLVGCTNIPLASGKGSGGRDHSLLRLFEPGQISVRSPGSARADEALGDLKWGGAGFHAAVVSAPSSTTPAVTYFQKAISSFRAKATIMTFRIRPPLSWTR